jgi:hypothetical protein
MSKPRIQLEAVIDTEAHADTIIAAITTQLIGKNIFESHNLARDVNDEGKPFLVFDCRFNSRIDRDDIKTWIRNQVKDHPVVKTWVQSVKLTTHLCTHGDIEVKNCKTTEYVVDFQR